jgi:aspartyl aminopeptidase
MRKSFLISADMAHAIHPNYSSKHEANHQPKMHEGLVIKQNCNQKYATTAISSFFVTEIASRYTGCVVCTCVVCAWHAYSYGPCM